jgi:hypothetical protein
LSADPIKRASDRRWSLPLTPTADWYGWEHDSFSGIDRRDDSDVSSNMIGAEALKVAVRRAVGRLA